MFRNDNLKARGMLFSELAKEFKQAADRSEVRVRFRAFN